MPDTMSVQFPAPVPPPEAFTKDQPIGAPVTQNTSEVSPDQTIYAQTKDGFASLPASSFDSLMQYDPSAKIVPPPSQGQVLVKLSSGHGATLPVASLEALRKQDPDVKVIATGGATANMQESPLSEVEKATLAASNTASAVGSFAGDVASGAAKGSAETLSRIGPMVPSLAPHGFTAARPAVDLTNQDFHDANTGEWLGKGVEGLAEWMTAIETGGAIGSDVVKALSASDRLGMVAKAAKFLDNNPRIARVIGNAALSAGSTAIHGGTAQDALASGIAGAATSGVLEGIGKGLDVLSQPALGSLELADTVKQAYPLAAATPTELSKNISGALSDIADNFAAEVKQDPELLKSDWGKLKSAELNNPLLAPLKRGELDNSMDYLTTGPNTLAKVTALKNALGPQKFDSVYTSMFKHMVDDYTDDKGNTDITGLTKKFFNIPDTTREALFASPSLRILVNKLQEAQDSRDMMIKAAKVGAVGLGALSGYEGYRGNLKPLEAFAGLAAAIYGVDKANSLVSGMLDNPASAKVIRVAYKAAQKAAVAKPAAVYGASHFIYDPDKGLTPAAQPTEQPAQ